MSMLAVSERCGIALKVFQAFDGREVENGYKAAEKKDRNEYVVALNKKNEERKKWGMLERWSKKVITTVSTIASPNMVMRIVRNENTLISYRQ